jgi:hypothetical protein
MQLLEVDRREKKREIGKNSQEISGLAASVL